MLFKKLPLISLLLFSSLLFAQDKMLVPEEIMSNRNLYPGGLSNLQWKGNSGFYTWQDGNNLLQGNLKNETTDTLLKTNEFNDILEKAGLKTIKRLPFFSWKDETTLSFTLGNQWVEYQTTGKQLQVVNTVDSLAENTDPSPETRYIAYTIGNNLYIATGTGQVAVTADTDKGIVNGQSVHRNEFGISKGTYWSPDGRLLAFYRMDETMVTEYPLVDITARVAETNDIRYPMAGMKSHHVTLGVFNTGTGKTIFLKTGEPEEQYLTNIAWSPDGKTIYIAVLNRDQNHLWLNQYDAGTGDFIRTLFEEKNDRYVEPLNPMTFLPDNPGQFIWQSQRDGYNHLYLYNTDGKLIRQLTQGPWVVTGLEGFDASGKGLFYTSTAASPLENRLYYLELSSGKSTLLTGQKGTHNVNIRPDGRFFISRYSNLETPARIYAGNLKGREVKNLFTSPDPLKDYLLGETSLFTVKADDGTDLWCRMIKPASFDPAKKYPVFIYVYGGPHAQLITESWLGGAGHFLNYMAQQGYVVFTLDNRGSANRGFEFESTIHRRLGVVEMADQLKGVKYLKSLPYVDSSRIGVDGWSYGGFMAITLKLKNPGVFKVTTAGGPVTDWKYYEVMYGERYMDTPEQNPDGYSEACLMNHIGKLEGKLMIIHGALDNTVVWQQSLQFLKTAVEKQKQVDYFVYPTHEHNVRGIDRAHLFRKLATYYNENL
ncbi:DPP IV N-terminal domain-containing protein [Lentimicrobium sp.]|jgi:dipeptidyl-peptidase-4|uniref:S9 family peptidase n=2 Tax=Lentimicrobium sp. TaxID=2034841 RepID=UPI002C36A4AB|nr:DPP IV N-terminal domain-containing protein [Lentimicrobium sp.]HPF65622.1 DPP IV N-terminal domain-containing protein [Lentimicrobium sp.]